MRYYKTILMMSITLLLFTFTTLHCQVDNHGKSFYVASWNIENLFDTKDDPNINDEEFLPEGSRQWTIDRFETKISNLAKVINHMNDGCGPDIIAFQEVENLNVLKWLVYRFKHRDYIIAHRDSPDERGIDVALFYDRKVFDIEELDTLRVEIPTGTPTRYILHVALRHKNEKSIIHLFVNHWPSRRGGEVKSEPNRIAAARVLKNLVDKILSEDKSSKIILLGDFNDEPDNKSIQETLGASEFNCSESNNNLLNLAYTKASRNEGSYLFGSTWNMIDQIIISGSLFDKKGIDYLCDSYEVIKPDFMVIKEGERQGGPLPTYSGSRYLGGYSDHFPVGAKFILTDK
ncbi:MAG TPA: endonuclease/exonuclease/phosphatase family protein [Melioribacteraceae bacterium]|nr:endonuclease/exonuclease/phosphatase family protein [Melioribacteraceae bacterium]